MVYNAGVLFQFIPGVREPPLYTKTERGGSVAQSLHIKNPPDSGGSQPKISTSSFDRPPDLTFSFLLRMVYEQQHKGGALIQDTCIQHIIKYMNKKMARGIAEWREELWKGAWHSWSYGEGPQKGQVASGRMGSPRRHWKARWKPWSFARGMLTRAQRGIGCAERCRRFGWFSHIECV